MSFVQLLTEVSPKLKIRLEIQIYPPPSFLTLLLSLIEIFLPISGGFFPGELGNILLLFRISHEKATNKAEGRGGRGECFNTIFY